MSPRLSSLDRFGPSAIFVFACLLRLAYWFDVKPSPLFDVFLLDADYYDRMAKTILSGDWLCGREVFTLSPLYPYFLALLYALTDESIALVKLIQHTIGAATCGILTRIGIRLGGPVAGCSAGILAATYGIFIFSEGTFENEFLVIFLNTLALKFLLDTAGPRLEWSSSLAGICVGLSIAIRPNAALLAAPALCWILLTNPSPLEPVRRSLGEGGGEDGRGGEVGWGLRRAVLRPAFLFLLGCLLPVLPITARNYMVSSEWVLTTPTGGQIFYISTLPAGGGGYVVPEFVEAHPDSEFRDFKHQAEKETGRPMAAGEVSGYWFRKAFDRIRVDPGGFVSLLGKKVLAFCNVDEAPDNYDYTFGRRYSRVLSLPLTGFEFIFPLAVLGMCLATPEWRRWSLPWGFLAIYLFSILVFYQSYRFRLPAIPTLLLFSGLAASWILQKIADRAVPSLLVASCVVFLAVFTSRIELPQMRLEEDLLRIANGSAEALHQKGRTAASIRILQDALRLHPGDRETLRHLAGLWHEQRPPPAPASKKN